MSHYLYIFLFPLEDHQGWFLFSFFSIGMYDIFYELLRLSWSNSFSKLALQFFLHATEFLSQLLLFIFTWFTDTFFLDMIHHWTFKALHKEVAVSVAVEMVPFEREIWTGKKSSSMGVLLGIGEVLTGCSIALSSFFASSSLRWV